MERKFSFEITKDFDSKEIKTLLEMELRCSSNIISKLKKGDYVLLNGKRATVRQKLTSGDVLEIILPSEKSDNIVPNGDIKFGILFEDEDILVVDKPAGVPTHPSINHYSDTLANGIMHYMGGNFTFRAVNRLDRETSGVVLVAKNILSAHLLSEQVKEREIVKRYFAITENIPKEDSGVIDAPIARECESIIKRCVRLDGKESRTNYRVLKKNKDFALVTAEPVTGRTHQIRVHFSFVGCPLYGDVMYGSKVKGERVRLHCGELTFKHPITLKPMTVKAKPPEDFDFI